jgi:membrane-bound lytic murein transglycosylase D
VEEFRQLNPQMNKPVILAAGTPQVLLPYDNAATFVRNLSRHHGALATWTAWVVPRTMKTAEAARQAGMGEPQFREVNRIPPRMLVKVGSTLLVPRGERRQDNVVEAVADNATLALAPDVPPLKTVRVKVGRKGSSVAAMARQYKMAPATLASLNRTTASAALRPGQWVLVQVPNRGKAVAKGGRGGAGKVKLARPRGGKVRVAAR